MAECLANYLTVFLQQRNSRKISEADISLSKIWLDTTTNGLDQAKGKEKSCISLYGPFHNVIRYS